MDAVVLSHRDCIRIVPLSNEQCACGAAINEHEPVCAVVLVLRRQKRTQEAITSTVTPWAVSTHTRLAPTNAWGVVEFERRYGALPLYLHTIHIDKCTGRARRARYMRLAYDTAPEKIITLLYNVLPHPCLVITCHGAQLTFFTRVKRSFTGDNHNIERADEFVAALRQALARYSCSINIWLLTAGVNNSHIAHLVKWNTNRDYVPPLKQVAQALSSHQNVVAIGIAPWGLLRDRRRLVGTNHTLRLSAIEQRRWHAGSTKSPLVLNYRHNCFLLCDNGTVGKRGAAITLRQRLEEHIRRCDNDRRHQKCFL